MILRFQSRSGQFRLTVDEQDEIVSILDSIMDKLPKEAVRSSVTISPKPHGADKRAVETLTGVTFKRIGFT